VRVHLITPAGAASHQGNRTTALRWARLLRELGHQVQISQEWSGEECDLLVALHARKSFASIEAFRSSRAGAPLVVALTGTDLYMDLASSAEARKSLELASRLVLLQPLALDALPETVRGKARVIYQSAEIPVTAAPRREDIFQICALIHLRPVKDPLRAALAVRSLPESSKILLVHAGAALTPEMAEEARAEERRNPRYRWMGDLPPTEACRLLASSRVLVLTSQLEGGANVISEALAASVPVVSSRIPGSLGLLGSDYPGYFPVGDTQALRVLLQRVEADSAFYQLLKDWCAELKSLVEPSRERESWRSLLRELL